MFSEFPWVPRGCCGRGLDWAAVLLISNQFDAQYIAMVYFLQKHVTEFPKDIRNSNRERSHVVRNQNFSFAHKHKRYISRILMKLSQIRFGG
jgi:hypothetical protein